MNNIYYTLYDIYNRIYTSNDNTHIRLNPEIRDYIYITHGINIGEAERCYMKSKIDSAGSQIPVDIIYLNEEQTKQWKSIKSLWFVESFIGRYDIHLIIYVPDFTLYINNDYFPIDRLIDLSYSIHEILDAYYRSNLVVKYKFNDIRDEALAIALKLLFDLDICTVKDFEGKELKFLGITIKFNKLEELKSASFNDLLINKACRGYFIED